MTVQYETIPVRTYREARRIPKVSYLEVVGIPMHLRGKGGEASVSGVESSSAATTGGARVRSICNSSDIGWRRIMRIYAQLCVASEPQHRTQQRVGCRCESSAPA